MAIVTNQPAYRYSHTIGALSQSGAGFNNPVDVAVAPGGLLYVLSRSNARDAPLGILRISICTIDEEFNGQFGAFGEGDGGFVWPTAITRDGQGHLYVSDEHRHDVQVFNQDGEFLCKFGGMGTAPGRFNRPSGLAIDGAGNAIVADTLNQRVQKLTPQGQPLLSWGREGRGDGEFNMPWGVAVDGQGQIYVADWRNDRVQKFSPDGRHVATFGSSGREPGQFRRPAGVAVDDLGRIYVADWGNERVQALEADGTPLAVLTGDATLSQWALKAISVDEELKALRAIHGAEVEAKEKLFYGPRSVKLDEAGHVIVADSCRHRLQIYQRL